MAAIGALESQGKVPREITLKESITDCFDAGLLGLRAGLVSRARSIYSGAVIVGLLLWGGLYLLNFGHTSF